MSQLILRNEGGIYERKLYTLDISTLSEILPSLSSIGKHFALLLACDARSFPDETLIELGEALIRRGLAYLVTWGPDCERVHDMVDMAEREVVAELPPESVVMTTWHSDESLAEAFWYFLYCTYPDEAYADTCKSAIAVTVGNSSWGEEIKTWLNDSKLLNREVGLD